jgi:hypothetical protein
LATLLRIAEAIARMLSEVPKKASREAKAEMKKVSIHYVIDD